MTFILLFIGWLIGLFVTSFTLVQVGVIMFFGIPKTTALTKQGLLQPDNPIRSKYFVSLAILLALYFVVGISIYYFVSSLFIGFLLGTGMVLLFSLGQLGSNQNNLQDYLSTNRQYLTEDLVYDESQKKFIKASLKIESDETTRLMVEELRKVAAMREDERPLTS